MTTNIGTKDIDFSLINDAPREAFLGVPLGEVKELHTSFMSDFSISDMTTQLIELGGTVFGDESDTQSILDTSIVISGIPIYGFPSDGSTATGSGKFGPIFKNPNAGTPNYVCIFNGSGYIKFSFFDINDDGNYSHVTRGYYPSSNNLTASEINNYINNISYSDLPGIFSYSKLGSTYNDTAFTNVNDDNNVYKLQYLITKPLQLFSSEIEIIDPDYDSNQITYSGNNSTGGRLNDNTANWEGKDSEIDDNYDDHKKWYQIKVSENSDELKNIVGVSIKNVQNNVKKWKFYSVNHKIPEWGIAHNIGPVIDNPNQIINKSSSENWHKALFSKSCLFYNKNKVQGFRFTLTHTNDSSFPFIMIGLINKGSQGIYNAYRFFQYSLYLKRDSPYLRVYETNKANYHNWDGGTGHYFGTDANVESSIIPTDTDIFEVRVIDRTVSYLKNNKTVFTSSKPAKFPLYFGITAYRSIDKGVNLELYGDWCVPIPNKRLTFTQSFNSTDYKNVIWNKDIDIGDPTYVGLDEIKKTTSVNTWNTFVVSKNHIYRNDNEWQGFKFKANSVAASSNGGVMCGLGNRSTARPINSEEWPNKDSTSADDSVYKVINYSMFLYGTNGLHVYETGGNEIDGNVTSNQAYTSDKELEIRVKGTRVEYLYDGNVFHRSTAPVKSFPLFIECSMSYQIGTGVKDFKLYGDWTLNESRDFFYGETDKNQYNIFFEEPISCNAIRFQPIEWDGSEPQAKMGLIATKNEIGDGSLQIYDPEYKYHYTNSANMIYLNGTSNSLGLYDKGRISEDDHISAPVKYATSWVPENTLNATQGTPHTTGTGPLTFPQTTLFEHWVDSGVYRQAPGIAENNTDPDPEWYGARKNGDDWSILLPSSASDWDWTDFYYKLKHSSYIFKNLNIGPGVTPNGTNTQLFYGSWQAINQWNSEYYWDPSPYEYGAESWWYTYNGLPEWNMDPDWETWLTTSDGNNWKNTNPTIRYNDWDPITIEISREDGKKFSLMEFEFNQNESYGGIDEDMIEYEYAYDGASTSGPNDIAQHVRNVRYSRIKGNGEFINIEDNGQNIKSDDSWKNVDKILIEVKGYKFTIRNMKLKTNDEDVSYEIKTTTNETARNIHGVVVKGGFGEELTQVDGNNSWQASEDWLTSRNGHLVSIHSLTENEQITSWAKSLSNVTLYPWIGGIRYLDSGTSSSGNIIWTDGSPYNYEKQPSNRIGIDYHNLHLYKNDISNNWDWGTHKPSENSTGLGKLPKRGYVTKWKFQYLDSNDEWQYVDNEKIFSIASNGWNISNQIEFSKSVFAKKIRFIPWEWDTICAARMGLLIRDEINIGESFRNTSIINNSQYKKDIVMDLNTSISFSNILWDKNNSSSYMDFYDDGSIETNRTSYINLGHGNDYWPAIAMSTEIIHYDPNNYQSITFQKKTLASGFIIGLSQNHTGNESYEDWNGGIHRYGHIDFGLVVRENSHANSLEIYERVRSPSSSNVFDDSWRTTSPETTLDDIFEIRVKGTTVEYLKNDTVFYTSLKKAIFPLYVRTAISTAGGGIKNIQLNRSHFPDTDLPELTWNSSLSSGIKYENDGFIKNITGGDDNAYAISNNVFYYTNDPHVKIIQGVRFRVTHSDVHLFIGFGDKEWGTGDKRLDMKFNLHIRSDNNPSINVYNTESITYISESFQTDAYSPEDIFEIRITDTTVHYLKNNKIFYTDTTTATFPLYLKAFITSENKGLKNMEIFKTVLPSIGDEASQTNLTWDTGNSVDINFDNFSNDGSITPISLTSSWESRTVSQQVIHYNPNEYQGIRFKLNETNKHKMIGLGVDTNWEGAGTDGKNHYNAIHFASYFTDENKYRIYESNPKLGVSSSNESVARINIDNADFASNISTSDIFEIRVIGYTVEYLRNDEVYYTSENKATFPLYVKACLYNGGFNDIYLYTINQPNLYMEHTLNFNNEEKAFIDNIIINDSEIAKQVNRFSIFGYNDENLNIAFDPVFDPPYTHHSSPNVKGGTPGSNYIEANGRLSSAQAWVLWTGTTWGNSSTYVSANNTQYYYQIDYSADGADKTLVAGVVTYGRGNNSSQWVTKWKFQYSSDGSTWEWVDDEYEFDGNTHNDQRNMVYFASPVNTTGIRFFPTGYNSYPSARMGLLLHIPNNKWEIIKHFSVTDRNRLYYIDNVWKYKPAHIRHESYVDNSTKVKLLFNIAKSYKYYKLIYKKYKNDTFSNNNNIEIYGAKIDENKLLVELIEPIKNLTLNSNFVINSNMAGEISSNLTLSSSSSINAGNNTITINENLYGEYNDKWIKVTSGSYERKIIIPNFIRVQSSNIASTTNWVKVDNCINGSSGNQNVAITSEAGWGVGDDGSSGPFYPSLSSEADQIMKIKDWIENENINNYGYTYYICFSFISSDPSRPQIFYRTNGENDLIYNVETGTASNNSWDFYYIGSVFDLPNGVGNPLQGKLLYDITPSSYTSQYFQPDNSIKVLYNGGLTFRFNTTSISGNYPTSSTTTSYPWKFSNPITTPSTNDEIVDTISSSNKMFSTVGTNSPTTDSVNSNNVYSTPPHNNSSLIKLEVISENGYNIHWNVSSESSYDHFYMLTSQDNNSWTSREYRKSGTQSGTVAVTSNDKYLICVYSKDGSVDSRNDAGYFYISFN